ncbi:MAG: 4'-phosphopantetheinyl transferase superfamily protein [Verrucomicrobiae bacterium]
MKNERNTEGSALPEPAFVVPPARLVPGQVHVWRFSPAGSDALPDAERKRAGEFQSDLARAAFAAGRAGIRRAAAIYTGLSSRDLVISQSPSGKPFFEGVDLHFNLSHSGGVIAAAFSGDPVGLDIEPPGRQRDFHGIARRFFHPDEAEGISCERDFLDLWTAKEAVLKLAGCGLAGGLERVRADASGAGWLDGRRAWLERFRIGECVCAAASFQEFKVKGWFEI